MRQAGRRRAGDQPGGKCEFLPVCLTAIKAAAPHSRHWAARLPGNPLSWVLFEVEEGGSKGEEEEGGRQSPQLSHAQPPPAPSTWRRLPTATQPFLQEDNLLTRAR